MKVTDYVDDIGVTEDGTENDKEQVSRECIREYIEIFKSFELNSNQQPLLTPLIKYKKDIRVVDDEKSKKRIIGEILFRTLVMLPVCALAGSMEFLLKFFLLIKNLIVSSIEIIKCRKFFKCNGLKNVLQGIVNNNILYSDYKSSDYKSPLKQVIEWNSQIVLRQEHIKKIKKSLLKSLLPFIEIVGMIIVCLLQKYGIIKIQKLFPSLNTNAKQMAVLLTFCFLGMFVLCAINNVIRRGESCCTSSLLRASFVKDWHNKNIIYIQPNCLPLGMNSAKLELSTNSRVTLKQLPLEIDYNDKGNDTKYITYCLNSTKEDNEDNKIVYTKFIIDKEKAKEVLEHNISIKIFLLPFQLLYGLIKIIALPFLLAAIALECKKEDRKNIIGKEAKYTLKFIPETIKNVFGCNSEVAI